MNEKLFEIISKKVDLADKFAWIAHHGVRRKGRSKAPYHDHVKGVATILEGYGCEDEDILSAAFLHDTIEDVKGLSLDTLEEMFGNKVAELVSEVTNSPDLDGMEKEQYMNNKMVNLSNDALTIKLGDCLYNCSDSPKRDQIDRMHNNINFLKRNRKLTDMHAELIAAFEASYTMKIKGGLHGVGK
jgi:(p)ppGpp synthase/HD superfamily hydrolase